MFRVYLIVLLVLLSSCQNLNSSINNSENTSGEVITDPVPFTDIPADIAPEEGHFEILSRLSLNGQNLGLTTTANLGVSIGEGGRVSVKQANSSQWHTITLLESYQSPVVIMQPLSYNAGDPAVVRIKDVTSNSFKFQIDEWEYLNGAHGTEVLSYLVLEEGIWSFKNGLSFEAGKKTTDHNFKQVNLQLNFTNPVILTQSQTYNGTDPITTRQKPSGSGFQVKVQEEEGGNGTHGNEMVGYIVVSQGQERLGNVAIVAGIKGNVTQNFKTINFGFSVPVNNEKPVFLAGIQSYNEADTAALRYKSLSTNTNTVKVRVEEEQSADTETLHAAENVGYLLLANIPPVVPAWTKQFGTNAYDKANAIAARSNRIMMVGGTEGSLQGSNAGSTDAFVRRHSSSNGNVLWTRQFGTNFTEEANGVAIDNSNNILVVGYTDGSLEGTNAGGQDAFIRKYSNTGNVLWTDQFGTSSFDQALAVAIADNTSAVVVVGYTRGSLEGTNTSPGVDDVFVRKYDNSGNVLWTDQFGTSSSDQALAVAVDSDYNILVAGQTFGSLSGSNFGNGDAFVRKYNSAGNALWTKQFGSFGSDSANGVAIDSNDQIVVAGHTQGGLARSNLGLQDAFVRQYDTDGNDLWTKQFGSSDTDIANAVTIDSNNNIMVTGETYVGDNTGVYDVFVRQYDSNDNFLWSQQFGTGNFDNDKAYGVAVDSNNNIFITGFTHGNLAGNNQGGLDAFVRKYVSP